MPGGTILKSPPGPILSFHSWTSTYLVFLEELDEGVELSLVLAWLELEV
jgi:hypothetical protein